MSRAVCFYCTEEKISFPTIAALCQHIVQKHTGLGGQIFRCGQELCNMAYDNIDTFKKHLKSKHNIPSTFTLAKRGGPRQNLGDISENTGEPPRDELNVSVPGTNEYISENTGASPRDELDVSVPGTREDCDRFCLKDFQESLVKCRDTYVAKQYSKPSLPRSHVQTAMSDMNTFLSSGPFAIFGERLFTLLENSSVSQETVAEMKEMWSSLLNPFDGLQTEYRRLQYFTQSGNFIRPISVYVGRRLENVAGPDGTVTATYQDVFIQFIPPSQVLKKFLEMSDVLDVILSHMEKINQCDGVLNVIQSALWKEKISKYREDDIVLPYVLCGDDFEPNNALGPHSGKLGAIYGLIACMPPECRSVLENIFLVLLYDSNDRVEFGNDALFPCLIKDLNMLAREGLSLNLPTGERKLYVVLAFFLGDNLALQQYFNLAECFIANYFCRLCKTPRFLMQTLTSDTGVVLRNVANYDRDVAVNDSSSTGINKECILNEVEGFHVTTNTVVDILHDLPEGTCDVIMLSALDHFIRAKLFSVETLNFRMDFFDWGPVVSNKPPLFSAKFLENAKLKMTGSEKLVFVQLFGILVGDLVPDDDKYWELYLSLRKVLDIAFSPVVTPDTPDAMRAHVQEMLDLHLSLDPNNKLKPKMHFLTHYGLCMEAAGPVKEMNCIRFEGKHKELKASATATQSRRNLSLTVAMKHQLGLSFRFQANESLLPPTESGPGHIFNLQEHDHFFLFRDSLPLTLYQCNFESYVSSWISYKGTRYCSPMLLLTDIVDDSLPSFAEIKLIVTHKGEIIFICEKMRTIGFKEHVHGYQVVRGSQWISCKVHDLIRPKPLFAHKTVKSELIVVMM